MNAWSRLRRPVAAPTLRAGTLFALLLSLAHAARADLPVAVPVTIPYALVRNHLAERVFTGSNESVQVVRDRSGCNSLTLSAPRIAGTNVGRLRVLAQIEARGGTPIAGTCVLPFTWVGAVDLDRKSVV